MKGLDPPRQERSARTLERLLDAAESLLGQRIPSDVSIAEICRRSGVTTGAFYARFRDRDSLLRVLERRVYDAFEAALGDLEAAADLRGALRTSIGTTARLYREYRGTLRAISISALDDPDLATRAADFNRRLMPQVVARVMHHSSEIAHPDPASAVHQVIVWVVTILRQQILFEELGLQGVAPDVDGLVHLAFVFLTQSKGDS